MPAKVYTPSSPKITDWALPLAERYNLFSGLDQWLRGTVQELQERGSPLLTESTRQRALFMNHDYTDAQDRRILQFADIWRAHGYETSLVAIGRSREQFDLSEGINIGDGWAAVAPIFYDQYRFLPHHDPVTALFFYNRFPDVLDRLVANGVNIKLRERLEFRLRRWMEFISVDKLMKSLLGISVTERNSDLCIHNLKESPLFITWAELDAALTFKKSFDVIVVADLPSLPAGVVLKHLFGARLVYDAHELYPEQEAYIPEKQFALSIWESFCLRHVDLAFTVSPWAAEFMDESYRLPKGSIQHFSNAPASAPFVPKTRDAVGPLRSAIGVGPERNVLLFHGSVVPLKNVEVLIEGFSKMTCPNVSLVFLGYGEFDRYIKLANELNVKNVYFLPAVLQKDLPPWVADADAVLIPYPAHDHNLRNCTPNKLYDCIALSVPLLANRDSNTLEAIFSRYKIGLQFRTDSAENLATDLDAILREDRLSCIRRHGDFAGARRDFGWDGQIPHIEKILTNTGFFEADEPEQLRRSGAG